MIEGRGRARLLLEAPQPLRIGCQRGWQDLDRDVTCQARIAGAVHFAHAAGAEKVGDEIRAEASAGASAMRAAIIRALSFPALFILEPKVEAYMMRSRFLVLAFGVAVSAGSAVLAAQAGRPAPDAVAARVQTLEDREAIRALLVAYASTLDTRDFAGFEQFWAKDAEFIGGGGNNAKGPAAIRDLLQGLLTKNAAPTRAAISIWS